MTHVAEVTGIATGETPGGEEVPAALLRADGTYLPIFVTDDQADAIRRGLADEPFDRPLTHDLFVGMLAEFGGAFDRVRIDDLREGTFYAKVDVQRYEEGEPRSLTFDARPSDAIAIAIRADCPIEVSDEILDAAGRSGEELGVDGVDTEE
ncbi:bifunctional nuclease family protein [Halolamina salifodinae]|uniref:Bifunctional DNase/RNase n=1 Tax=Halolamina salifodinae TaxID=1202767 RepID=A0A8T4GS74_9EURY|nr:bifunctional nuclease family protein [Halolamina salifodinae]MBP1985719.1 bifunctional DNase/RNase [Halolamina salifodinae]